VSESRTLGVYEGIPCHHWNEELPLIADVLRDFRPTFVVEVGTMHGGFAAFLADTVKEWHGTVLTIDHVLYEGVGDISKARENLFFLQGDVFSPFVSMVVEKTLKYYQRSCIYCDGGAKRQELPLLGMYADLVGVHDYGTEVSPPDCTAWAKQWSMYPVKEEEFAALQAEKGGYFVSRFWRRNL